MRLLLILALSPLSPLFAVTVPVSEPEPVREFPQLDPETVAELSKIIFAEANPHVEGFEAAVAVGNTIQDRADDPRYPDSIIDVIHQRGQFDGLKSDNYGLTSWLSTLAAIAALKGYRVVPPKSIFFLNPDLSTDSKWYNVLESRSVSTCWIGKHKFYSL